MYLVEIMTVSLLLGQFQRVYINLVSDMALFLAC